MNYSATLTALTNLTIPRFADWCQVFVYRGDGAMRRLATAHVNPSKLALLHFLESRFPDNPTFPDGTDLSIHSRSPQLMRKVSDDLLVALAHDAEHLKVLRALAPRSLILAPLIARGRVLGSILLIISESERLYGPDDLALIEQLAQRAANAIDRAMLFQAEQEARKLAEAAVKVREEFIAVAAHELNTPLTNLRGYAKLELLRIRRQGAADTGAVHRALTVIDQQSTRLASLVKRLLDATVLDLDRLHLDRVDVNLGALVEDVVRQYEPLLSHHYIDVDVIPDVDASIDVSRFDSVLTNLLDNAVRFSPDGGTIRVVLTDPVAGMARLTVGDDGPGIPSERRARLFERFYQVDGESYRSGFGLGLFISRKIVALHGGQIAAEFPNEGGTRFVVTLPIQARSLIPAHRSSTARLTSRPAGEVRERG